MEKAEDEDDIKKIGAKSLVLSQLYSEGIEILSIEFLRNKEFWTHRFLFNFYYQGIFNDGVFPIVI